ncbi:MAG: PRC-barrel domain-containing protein [Gammaproteobacteria bacterium]
MTLRISQLLGAPVVDGQGEPLGRITDLLVDGPQPASLCYALVDIDRHGGDTRTVAVPWSILQPRPPDRQVVLDVSAAALDRLRDFTPP